jgi:nitrate/nitrite transporter NarK
MTHLGLITGAITTIHHLSGGLWAYWGGVLFDRHGDYRTVLTFYGICCFLAAICALLIRPRRITLKSDGIVHPKA